MNCEEVQTRISEYLERSLDAISMKSMEVHLSSCSRCRVDADSLADCIQEVAGLPVVDPPLGFAQRVMAHVREINKKPTLWERLFLPTRVKIPLQATAVVLIGALALVLSQKEEKLNKQKFSQPGDPAVTSPAPSAQKLDQQKESTIVVERSVQENKPAKSTKPFADLAKQVPEQVRTSKAAAAPAGAEETQPAAASPPSSAKESESPLEDKKEAPRRRAIPAQEVSTAGEAMRSRSDTFGFGFAAGAGALGQPSLSAGPLLERSLSPLSEPNADIEFVVRRRAAQLRDQRDEPSFAATGKTAESRRTNPPPAAPRTSSIREIRWFTVAADRFEQFKKALESEAIIESERTPGVIESDLAQKIARELLIKVTISPSEQ
jgi:Putative zinc-finger